jgi:DNA invertase Pin-like site-specific DNA recombinase
VIGSYERASYGGQYASMAPLFDHYGVQLWMPEVGGRVDFASEDHEETMLALRYQSKREITRTRVRTAMAAQTREQGRYLGGHPALRLPARRRRAAPEQRPTPRGDGGRTG